MSLTRTERLAQQRAERRAARRARIVRPIELVSTLGRSILDRPDRISVVGARAQRFADRRARVRRNFRRTTAVVVAVGAGFIGVTGAYAYFTAPGGTGSGTTTSGSLQQPTGVTATVSASLIPDGSTHDLIVSLTNPNGFAIYVTGVQPNGPATVATAGIGPCINTGVSAVSLSNLLGLGVAPGAQMVTIPGAAKMDATSDSGCQNATFTIPVTLTVATS
jgi:hypothetical protein